MSESKKYIVVQGFLGGKLDETTGEGLTTHDRGDVIELSEEAAAIELHRNRIVDYDADTAAALKAAVEAEQQQGATS
jgi:hypothetical protein